MRMIRRMLLFLIAFGGMSDVWATDDPPRYFEMGDFTLESGAIIEDARVAYRTAGQLNKERSNIVLFPSWFTGTSAEIMALMVGTDKLLDPSRYYIIAVDALGNGVSSSPSNSEVQPGDRFPQFSMRDMVNAQYRLLTEDLEINHVHAVIGASMGGMQALQWMVTYPGFMGKVVSMAGTPRQTSYDLLLWHAELRAIEGACMTEGGRTAAMETVAAIHTLALQTPQYHVETTVVDSFNAMIGAIDAQIQRHDPMDWASQLRAMINHDIYESLPNSTGDIAEFVEARVMLTVGTQDHMVNPGPTQELAKQLNIEVLEVDNQCGHLALLCGGEAPIAAIAAFMED